MKEITGKEKEKGKEKGKNRDKNLIGDKGTAAFGEKDRRLLGNRDKDNHSVAKN
jgi:hypothetical protein